MISNCLYGIPKRVSHKLGLTHISQYKLIARKPNNPCSTPTNSNIESNLATHYSSKIYHNHLYFNNNQDRDEKKIKVRDTK